MMPRLSIVVPVYNDFAALQKCLDALQSQLAVHGPEVECLVVDNGSEASLDEIAERFPEVTFLEELTPGSYAARNAGVRQATGEFIAFTDSDCIPEEDWVEAILEVTSSFPSIDLHVGDIVLFADSDGGKTVDRRVIAYELATAFRQEYYANYVHFGPTANLIVRRVTFEKLQGFDQSLKSGADKKFGQNAWQAGFKIRFSPECVVRHPTRSTLIQLENKIRRIVGGDYFKAVNKPQKIMANLTRYILLRPGNSLRLIWTRAGMSVHDRMAASEVVFRAIGWQVSEHQRLRSGGQAQR